MASNQVESSSIQESSSVSIISPDHQGYPIKEPLTVSSESINPRLLVLIIDQVDRSKFSSSKDILRFLHSVAPDISVQFAYFLPKGGIAIHLSSVKDRDILSSLLPRDIFVDVKTLSEERVHYVYLKQVNFCISIDDLKSKLSNSIEVFSLARTISKVSGRPTTSIKLATNLKGAEYLLLGGLIVNGSPIVVEKKKSNPVVQCFNCLRFGHIASNCSSKKHCGNCSGPDCGPVCSNPPHCSNCRGTHGAFSSSCQSFIDRYALVTAQHSIN